MEKILTIRINEGSLGISCNTRIETFEVVGALRVLQRYYEVVMINSFAKQDKERRKKTNITTKKENKK